MLNYLVWAIFDKEEGLRERILNQSIKHKLNVSLTMSMYYGGQCSRQITVPVSVDRKTFKENGFTNHMQPQNRCSVSLSHCIALMCYIK
jgi:hypothetical protein